MENSKPARPFIKEVILENFLSYDYGRIALHQGLNVVMGPNGAGKSSILLGISVALGQAYTERSRRLSDLVKRGRDIARVTLMLDNSPRDGKKPLPYRAETIHLSRYIRKDGTYWFEIDFKEADKADVVETLGKLGLNPDNMLIIMHQGLGDTLSVVRPEEKLALVEDAVGLASYRSSLLEAKGRLEAIVAEEEGKKKELEAAQAALMRWQENYEKSIKIKGLRAELAKLRLEEAWCRVAKEEERLASTEARLAEVQSAIKDLEAKIEGERSAVKEEASLVESSLDSLVKGERNLSRLKADLQSLQAVINSYRVLEPVIADAPEDIRGAVERTLRGGEGRSDTLEDEIDFLEKKLASDQSSLLVLVEKYAATREKLAVLEYRLREKGKEQKALEALRESSRQEISVLKAAAESLGPKLETPRSLSDVQMAIKVAEAQLVQLGDIPLEVEQIYKDFQAKIRDLSGRLEVLRDNRDATVKEVNDRFKVWKKQLHDLVATVDQEYGRVLSLIGGNGRVRIVNEDDPVKAGLELLVAFRGQDLVPLDAYTQSGGERSSAVAAFLIALQKHIVSPFRAVDEFDVHMDPASRETFIRALHQYFKADDSIQYLVITPGAPAFYDASAHYIMVQKVAAASQVKVAKIAG